ncbi:MAG: restriction endonuclease subunit S [Candidatus Sulfotelmatobacter sp.]
MLERVALSEIATSVDYGVTASATEQPLGPKFLRITDIQNGSVDWDRVPWCECDDGTAAGGRLKQGDIVFARTGATTGKSFLIRDCPSNAVFASYLIRVRLGDRADSRYVSHYFHTPDYWAQISASARGVAQPGVNASTLKALKIPLPPIAEQRRIAEVLDRAEALWAKRRATLAQLDTLTQSIFLDLFGDPNFNERDWPLCRIGSVISDLRGGANLAPDDFVESGFPILHKGAIKPNGEVALDAKKKTFATSEYATANRRCQIDRRYLAVTLRDLVPTGPSIGLIANLQDGPFDGYLLAQGAYGFRVDSSKVTPEYLVFLSNMPSFRHVLRKYAVGSTQIHIRTPVYLDIMIPIPPLSAQHEFTRRVVAVKRLGVTQRSTLKKLNGLFSSLQTRAFVGQL